VAHWLDEVGADNELRATATGLRGFFLADPDELSLIALVDQFAAQDEWPGNVYRIKGGNDRLPAALAASLGSRLRLDTELVAVSHRGQVVRASVKHARTIAQISCDYLVLALPATTLRRVPITPALPVQQHEAISRLRYGRATKTLLQFARPFWRTPGQARAFGSALPYGAVWDGNEQQRGRAGILSFMAGGSASDLPGHAGGGGARTFVDALDRSAPAAPTLSPHGRSCGNRTLRPRRHAYFDPGSSRRCVRGSRSRGRLFFAGGTPASGGGGYMNGAIESGVRRSQVAAGHW
jgi:monoamine oxidase